MLTRMVVSPLISIHAPRTGSDTACWATAPSRSNFNPRSPHGERPGESSISSQLSQFQSTLPARGATLLVNGLWHDQIFQSTLPARGATGERAHTARMLLISIHAPRTGSDGALKKLFPSLLFQSTLPARGATTFVVHAQKSNISIHAPRTGSDALYFPRIAFARYFNPRSPHGERPSGQPEPPAASNFNPRSPHGERRSARTSPDVTFPFQPTLPARGATLEGDSRDRGPGHFNPRSPHGERPTIQRYTEYLGEFQPTLPARGATDGRAAERTGVRFQPTLPARGATRMLDNQIARTFISTHAPRTGSDDGRRRTSAAAKDFNPRSPHGERRNKAWQAVRAKGISTHAPRTGSDATYTGICQGSGISTHAPRTGSDATAAAYLS